MSPSATFDNLPDSKSPDLILIHPTPEERLATWNLNFSSWGGALSREAYLEREQYMMTVSLTRDGGLTHWILVDKNEEPKKRHILGTCESIRKRAFINKDGKVSEVITHCVGSVFCNPQYRGRKYASRMMVELGEKLRTFQTDTSVKGREKCEFTVLWSDVGPRFYADHGWHPFPSTHISFPSKPLGSTRATKLYSKDLKELCDFDVAMITKELQSAKDGKTHVALVPDHVQMSWHHDREDFICGHIFGKKPEVKGAIIGEKGHRVWAIWTRNYYGPLEAKSGNTLHILRLVIEDQDSTDKVSLAEQGQKVAAILEVAQAEAAKWETLHVELWNPTVYLQDVVDATGLQHSKIEREAESIASLMWYGEGSGKVDEIEWVGNEKYGWC